MCLVEFQLGAPLQRHQDPSQPAFWDENSGYGAKLNAAYKRKPKHFVVLGNPDYISLPERDGWNFAQAGWSSLTEDFERRFSKCRLLCDLQDCLAQFEIWEFTSMKARELSIFSDDVAHGSAAWEVLHQVYRHPGFEFSTAASAYRMDAAFKGRGK